MEKNCKNGWRVIRGYDVYVKSGFIIRGTIGDSANMTTVYPYYYSHKYGAYVRCDAVKVETFKHNYNYVLL